MGPGITLVIVGAILAFAVRTDGEVVDIQTVGLIFMLAGAAIIAYARREKRTREVETHVEQRLDATGQPQVVRETVTHEVVSNEEESGDFPQQPTHGHHPAHGHISGPAGPASGPAAPRRH